MSDRAVVPVLRHADMRQAEYFWRLLDARKAEVCELLEAQLEAQQGSQCDRAGARRRQRLVRALESELRSLDRMLVALRVGLGLPTLRRGL
jgi:hypothetical protein